MPTYRTPGVYVEEVAGGPRPITAVGTSTAGFVGIAPNAEAALNIPTPVNSYSQFERLFCGEKPTSTPLSHAVYGFFMNGGTRCYIVNIGPRGHVGGGPREGVNALEQVDEVAIVAAPGYTDVGSYEALLAHCEKLKDRIAILEAPADVANPSDLTRVAVEKPTPAPTRRGAADAPADSAPSDDPTNQPGLRPRASQRGFGAFYFPWIRVRDPYTNDPVDVAPAGHLAGMWARTDATRGVHKAPANEPLVGVTGLTYSLTGSEQDELNDAGVNCMRFFNRDGILVWGARTIASDPEWKYLSVRRLFNMIEESIAESTRWIVFEPNDRTLWKSIRRDIGAFLTRLWRDGALMGRTPEEAFFVLCDEETNPPEVIDAGEVHAVIGIAPVKPAEFIVFRISQRALGGATTSEVPRV
jgi:hypothetical protein